MGSQKRSVNHFYYDKRIIADYSACLLRIVMVQVWLSSVIAHDWIFRWRRFGKDFRWQCWDIDAIAPYGKVMRLVPSGDW